jgi:peptidyl-prolyl cis-trans isomerase SurA
MRDKKMIKNSRLKAAYWVLGVVLSIMSTTALADVHDGLAAIVGEEIITISALDKQFSLSLAQQKTQQAARAAQAGGQVAAISAQELAQFKQQVLENMVMSKILLNQAKIHDVEVTEQELQGAISQVKQRNHMDGKQFKAALAHDKISYHDFEKKMRQDFLIQKLMHMALDGEVVVSDAEVARTWRHMAAQSASYQVTDYTLVLSDGADKLATAQAKKKMLQFSQQLQKGKKAEDLLKLAHNSQITQSDLGSRTLKQMPAVFAKVLPTLKLQQASNPIRAENGYHVLILAGKQGELSRQQVRSWLSMQKFDKKRNQWMQQLRAMTYVKVLV